MEIICTIFEVIDIYRIVRRLLPPPGPPTEPNKPVYSFYHFEHPVRVLSNDEGTFRRVYGVVIGTFPFFFSAFHTFLERACIGLKTNDGGWVGPRRNYVPGRRRRRSARTT